MCCVFWKVWGLWKWLCEVFSQATAVTLDTVLLPKLAFLPEIRESVCVCVCVCVCACVRACVQFSICMATHKVFVWRKGAAPH